MSNNPRKDNEVIEVESNQDEVQEFNRVTFQHDIDCAKRLKKFDAIVEGMDLSQEWFDMVENRIALLNDKLDNPEINIWSCLIVDNYLQELLDIKRKLSEVGRLK